MVPNSTTIWDPSTMVHLSESITVSNLTAAEFGRLLSGANDDVIIYNKELDDKIVSTT